MMSSKSIGPDLLRIAAGCGDQELGMGCTCGGLNETLLHQAPGRAEDAGLLHAVIRRAGLPGRVYLVVPGSRAPLQIFFAEHV
jgi:hypothetical protein